MKTSRLKQFARAARGSTAIDRLNDLIESLDASSAKGVRILFDEAYETGAPREAAASDTFDAIERL